MLAVITMMNPDILTRISIISTFKIQYYSLRIFGSVCDPYLDTWLLYSSAEEFEHNRSGPKGTYTIHNRNFEQGIFELKKSFLTAKSLALPMEGVYAPGGPAFLAHTKQRVGYIVGLRPYG